MRMMRVCSLWFFTTSDLMLRITSVTSSTTPGSVVNSCWAPCSLTCVTALPSRLDSSIAPQAVADGDAEATLERLGHELAVGRRQRLYVHTSRDWAIQAHAIEYASVSLRKHSGMEWLDPSIPFSRRFTVGSARLGRAGRWHMHAERHTRDATSSTTR